MKICHGNPICTMAEVLVPQRYAEMRRAVTAAVREAIRMIGFSRRLRRLKV